MSKKILVIGEILFIIIASIFYIVKEIVPQYREEFGSSDVLIKTDYYKNMIEFNIDNTVNFAVILSEDKKIYHLMFFDKNALCLYNQNIENRSVDSALLEIVKLLIENDYLNSTSSIRITRYDKYYYEDFREILLLYLKRYNLNTNIREESSTLEARSRVLGLNGGDTDAVILRNMDYYSKEFSRTLNNVSNSSKKEEISEENGKTYTNNVYRKIENYVRENKIKVLDKNNTILVINLIPADADLGYYPSSNSWYYVSDGRVYAYIEIVEKDKKYGYCYKGSIDLNTKGEC